MIAAMISCGARGEDRKLTTDQLTALGIDVRHVISPCDPAGPPSHRAAAAKALEMGPPNRGLLFCEDDLDFAPDLPMFIHAAETSGYDAVYMFLVDIPARYRDNYPPDIIKQITGTQPMNRQIVRPPRYRCLFGSQCVWLSARAKDWAYDLATSEEAEREGWAFDSVMWRSWERASASVGVAVPHPVQHRQSRVGREPDNHQKRSVSYDLERKGMGVMVK